MLDCLFVDFTNSIYFGTLVNEQPKCLTIFLLIGIYLFRELHIVNKLVFHCLFLQSTQNLQSTVLDQSLVHIVNQASQFKCTTNFLLGYRSELMNFLKL